MRLPDGVSGNRLRALMMGLVLSLMLLASCGGGDAADAGRDIDLSDLETRLVELQEQRSPNLTVDGASCPDDVSLEEGSSFECIVTIEGVDAPYTVTLTEDNPEAETGSFHIEPAQAIIDVSIVTDFISGRVDESAEVECGTEKVIVSEVGGTFDCTISGGGESNTVQMVVKDIEGTVAFAE